MQESKNLSANYLTKLSIDLDYGKCGILLVSTYSLSLVWSASMGENHMYDLVRKHIFNIGSPSHICRPISFRNVTMIETI